MNRAGPTVRLVTAELRKLRRPRGRSGNPMDTLRTLRRVDVEPNPLDEPPGVKVAAYDEPEPSAEWVAGRKR